jgi:hypothetical protein
VEFDESYEPLFIEWGKSYINVMFQQFNISSPEFSPELCVLTSSSPSYICSKEGIEKWKVSVHIIVTNCLLYKHELKEMVKCLNAFLDNNADYYLQYSNYMWEKFFDESVYSPNQKLRACYASKRGENRPMKLVEGTFKDSIVTIVDGDNLPIFRFEHKFKAPERNKQNCTVLTSDDVDGHRELLAMIKLAETERTNRGLWRHICCAMKDNGFEENDWLAFGEDQESV